mmetsp:Transcript_90589/g.161345  ORF Transcript_90589/g.161345 Transcript_90589/m.161345 type:complete len:109 (-) Transcript_90589:149-475(-)
MASMGIPPTGVVMQCLTSAFPLRCLSLGSMRRALAILDDKLQVMQQRKGLGREHAPKEMLQFELCLSFTTRALGNDMLPCRGKVLWVLWRQFCWCHLRPCRVPARALL